MVAIVTGNSLGWNLGSLATLGQQGALGNASQGAAAERVLVNAATGNLVLQDEDSTLLAKGPDALALRTYNSQGLFNDDNGDNWSSGSWLQPLALTGTLNAAGSTLARTDRDGSVALYTFDATAGLYRSSDGAGAHDTITWIAASNQLEWREGSSGLTQRYEASGAFRLLSTSDPSGNTLAYSYDTQNRLVLVADASGEQVFYDYGADGNLQQVRTQAANGSVSTRVRYGYDTLNRLASVTVDLTPADNSVADGKRYLTSYEYEGASKRLARVLQEDGTALAFTYVIDAGKYKVQTITDALGHATVLQYGAGSTTVRDALGAVTTIEFDTAGRLTRIAPPAGGASSFSYDAGGNVQSATDGAGRVVSYDYDAKGNQVLQRDALGNAVTRTFDARNQLQTESIGTLTRRLVYDAGGRNLLRFEIGAEGRVTEHRYDAFGQRVATIRYGGNPYAIGSLAPTAVPTEAAMVSWAGTQSVDTRQRVDLQYDARGSLQTRTTFARLDASGSGIVDGSQGTETFVHDAAGRLLQAIAANGGSTSYSYDSLGRLLASTDASGHVESRQYATGSSYTVSTQASGLTSTSTYDVAGRLTSVAQSVGTTALGTTSYTYDADDLLRMTQDPTGVRHWFLYDAAGRRTGEVDDNGTLTETVYDGSGRVAETVTYATVAPTAALVSSDGTATLTAMLDGIRPARTDQDARTWNAYDSAGRLMRVAHAQDAGTTAAVTELRYDAASRVVAEVAYATPVAVSLIAPGSIPAPALAPDGSDRTIRHFYDAEGLLVGTLDADGYLSAFSYTAAGQLFQTTAYAKATDSSQRAAGTLAQLTPATTADDIRSSLLYDQKGQRVGEVDGEGYLTETSYDAAGQPVNSKRYANRVTAVIGSTSTLDAIRPALNAKDRLTVRGYDAMGRLVQETNPEGTVTQYTYDEPGRLVSTRVAANTDEARTLSARYDAQGRLVAELSADGAALLTATMTPAQVDAIWAQYAIQHTYDAAGRRTSSTDQLGARTLFFYNGDGALTYTVNALGEVQGSSYDVLGRVVEQVSYGKAIALTGLTGGLLTAGAATALAAASDPDQDGRVAFTYNPDGRVATRTEERGKVTSYQYDAFGDEVERRESLGNGVTVTSRAAFDHRGLRTDTTADLGGINATTSAIHDAFGRLAQSVDANHNTRKTFYDRLGRVVSTVDPTNASRSTSYDAFARVLAQTDALGKVTSYEYDDVTRSVKVTTPEGIQTTTRHSRHGQVVSVTDGKGQVTSYEYDRSGRLKSTATPLSGTGQLFDVAGRLQEATDARGIRVVYAYDAANRLLSRTVDPGGLNLVTSYSYDARGRQASVTDPNNVVTSYRYENRGQVLRQIVDPGGLNLQTVYVYDTRGNTLSVTPPGGKVSVYQYDSLGRRTQETVDPAALNLVRKWAYDGNGNVIGATDAIGNTTRYAYDAADRLIFTLDPIGNLQEAGYDADGRAIRTARYATPVQAPNWAAPPTVDQIQALVVRDPARDEVENRVYDGDGRLAATVDGSGAVVRYAYDGNGNVVSRTAYAKAIDMNAWIPGQLPVAAADPAQDERQQTVYDALDRARFTVDGAGGVVAFAYDANGNVLERRAYATPLPAGTALTADALAAATAALASGSDERVRQTYDAANRLVWSVDGAGAVTLRNYDSDGRLVRRIDYGTAVPPEARPDSVLAGVGDRFASMVYDRAGRVVFQVDAIGGVTEQAYDGNGQVVARVAYFNALGAPVAPGASVTDLRALVRPSPATDRTTRYAYDGAGRQTLAIDGNGAVTQTQYDGAGRAISARAYVQPVDASALALVTSAASLRALLVPREADRTTLHVYDAAGREVYAVDPLGQVVQSQYDGIGRLAHSTRFANPVVVPAQLTPDAIRAALAPDSAQDRTEDYGYDAAGRRTELRDALGQTESYGYDALGRRRSFADKRRFTWLYEYDAGGRLLKQTSPAVSVNNIPVADEEPVNIWRVSTGVVTQFGYDALGRLVRQTDNLGLWGERTTRYRYDAAGHQVQVDHQQVSVYAGETAQALAQNGAASVAVRVEGAPQTPTTRTFYDALGNAVANIDVGGALSQKVYDGMGRVLYEVDALGYVTAYVRNAFGEVARQVRLAVKTALADRTVATAADAVTRQQLEAAVYVTGVNHGADREVFTSYDRDGHVLAIVEPSVYVYSTADDGVTQAGDVAHQTSNTWNAFGELLRVTSNRSVKEADVAFTTHYFDAAGREVATVDATGYVTQRRFDAFGGVLQVKEYANAMTPGQWSIYGYTQPAAATQDRTVAYVYDRLGRKTSETHVDVEFGADSLGTSVRGNVQTSYGYDAAGNLTQVVDGNGGVTLNYYDALGHAMATVAPERVGPDGVTTITPLTLYWCDADGHVLAEIAYANGAKRPLSSPPEPVGSSADDRFVWHKYDAAGRLLRTIDAKGASQYFSYDIYGRVAKSWRGVTGNEGIRTLFEADSYDGLGHLVESLTPASNAVLRNGVTLVGQAEAGVVRKTQLFNAFGEMSLRDDGTWQEYFDYDNAGRLWRTNQGDGIDRVSLFDAQGHVTGEIRNSGAAWNAVNLHALDNARQADALANMRRTDTRYDVMGRVTAKVEAARAENQGGVTVVQMSASADIKATQQYFSEETHCWTQGQNRVVLSWTGLAALGSGDIKVGIDYETNRGSPRTYTSGLLSVQEASAGTTLVWGEEDLQLGTVTEDLGIHQVNRIRVYKKDVDGRWQLVIDQGRGYGGRAIFLDAPDDPKGVARVQFRPAGTDLAWTSSTALTSFGDLCWYDASDVPTGQYEYQARVRDVDQTERVVSKGTMAVSAPVLGVIPVPLSFGVVGAGILSWASPGTGIQTLNYRVAGSKGAWSSLDVASRAYAIDGVDTTGLPPGSYEFELLWSTFTSVGPVGHATGTFSITPPSTGYGTPQVGRPPITGLMVGTMNVGGVRMGPDGAGDYIGGKMVNALVWDAANAISVTYRRLPDGVWASLPIDNSYQLFTDTGCAGTQRVPLDGLAPGDYELVISAGGAASTPEATARLTIYPKPADTSTTSTTTTNVWVVDDWIEMEGHRMVAVSGHWEAVTKTVTTTIPGGPAPAPTLVVTTPPYVPSAWVAGTPRTYGVLTNTVAGSSAISIATATALSTSPTQDGDVDVERPTVLQQADRWGNVLETTDPRSLNWKTSYAYNWNNQLVRQVLPDGNGAISADSPVTQIYLDRMGRQLAVRDANGNVNGQEFDAGGNLVRETRADTGVVRHRYDVFGDRIQTIDAMGNAIGFSYDKLGHMLSMTKGLATVVAFDANFIRSDTRRLVADTWDYDELGRQRWHINGNGEQVFYTYDLRNNLVQTRQPLGTVTSTAYDARGRKTAETDANGRTMTWAYSGTHLQSHVDLGGFVTNYDYDAASQLVRQTSTHGQNLAFNYDAAGQLLEIDDIAKNKITTYAYDMVGRHVLERVKQGDVVYQDNHIGYDTRGNLSDVADGRVHVQMEFDKVGNRTHIHTAVDYQGLTAEYSEDTDRYFRYDAMNRQVVVDAVDAAGNPGQRGHQLSYDKNGNRATDTFTGAKVAVTGPSTILSYDENYVVTNQLEIPRSYSDGGTGLVTEEYKYDALNRLASVVRDGVQIDVRLYDGADRVVQSGPDGNLPPKYAEIINQRVELSDQIGKEMRQYRYDANGRVLFQRTRTSDNALKTDVSWDGSQTLGGSGGDGYDAAGNVRSYIVKQYDTGWLDKYTTSTMGYYDSYVSLVTSGASSHKQPGSNTQAYDPNGYLVDISDATDPSLHRTFVNDSSGRALFVNQGGHIQRQLIVNGEMLGIYGVAPDPQAPSDSGKFRNLVDFNFGYARVSSNYPNASPGAYRVQASDTLQSIAHSAYGDSSLWYRIAEANGLSSSLDLRVGQTLNIPNRVGTISNNNSSFKPYDPSRIDGDKTPNLPMPGNDKGCGGVGKILMVVVAVVVSCVMGPGLLAAALSSIASQAVGLATGAIDHFSWGAVATSVVTAGVAAGVSEAVSASMSAAAQGAADVGTSVRSSPAAASSATAASGPLTAALTNAATQGVLVATGLQKKFDWTGVAAAGISAGVGAAVDASLEGQDFGLGRIGNQLVGGTVSGLARGMSFAAARGGRINFAAMTTDAFGNALGQSIAEQASGTSTRTMGAGPASAAENSTEYGGGLKVSNGLYDGWGPKFNVPDPLVKPAWDLYADGTPRLSAYQGSYDDDVAVSMPVEDRGPYVVGRPLADLPPIPRRIPPEPSAGQYVVGTVIERMDGIRARLDAMGEDPSMPEWLRFTAAAARGPGNWIPETVKLFAGAGGYVGDSQLRSQVNSAVTNFLSKDPIGMTKYAATRYWDDHSPLEIAADGFNLVAGGSISAPFGKLTSLAFRGTVTTVTEAGETALRWTQRLSDYSIEFPQMRTQALYSFAGAVDPRPLIPTIRNLRAEATALAPEGFEVVRISNGSAIMRYADDTYYSVPKGQYSLIPELRTMDTMGDVFTRRAQSIADSFDSRVSLTFEQSARLDATPDGWMKNRFLSAYKGSYVHAGLRDELPFIRGAEGMTYKTVGPDIVSSSGGMGLKYEITQLTPSLNAIYSHTKKYPSELLRYVTYR